MRAVNGMASADEGVAADAAASASTLLADARVRLAGHPRVRIGERRESRRLLGLGRAPRIVPVGEAWHLGALLITADGALATGEIVRARAEVIRGFTAESQRARAGLSAEAHRGGFAEGETVHIGWSVIDVDAVDRGSASGPLACVDGVAVIRWSKGAPPRPLADYLDDRLSLL